MKPLALLCIVFLASSAGLAPPPARAGDAGTEGAASPSGQASPETGRHKRLLEAQVAIDQGELEHAIAMLDALIAEYEAQYPEGRTRWYVSRDVHETLAYMTMAAGEKDAGYDNAQALIVSWADAYYLKGYALVELATSGGFRSAQGLPTADADTLARARAALESGLRLAPYNSRLLAELGQLQQLEKAWEISLKTFARAEDAAAFSYGEEKAPDLSRAKRGMSYALIELGRLDDAEKKLQECLKIDPEDTHARHELLYIEQLRAQKGR